MLCQSFAVRFCFSLPQYAEGEAGMLWLFFLTVIFLRFYYLNFLRFFIFWEVYLSLNCVWGVLSLNFLPCPGFCHLTVICNVFLIHSFLDTVLIPCQPYSSWGRGFLLWWVSFGRCWAVTAPYLYTPLTWSGIRPD